MGKRQRKAKGEEDMVKTSLKLPWKLWREAHIRALDEGTQLQEIVSRALAAYLRKGGAR